MARARDTAAVRKARELGIPPELQRRGFDKRTVDAMNAEAKARFNCGVGVITQEVARAEQLLASFDNDPWWRKLSPSRAFSLGAARAEYRHWNGRLEAVAKAVAATRT